MSKFVSVVLCGGEGKRLWPISNKKTPKQFIPLFKNKSLFELTILRLNKLSSNPLIIVTSDLYKNNVIKICKKLGVRFFLILEEEGRNTSAAIYFSAKLCKERNLGKNIFITPSDHFIENENKFNGILTKLKQYQIKFNWLTLGIVPKFPSIGYGYIQLEKGGGFIRRVLGFKEKPSKKIAEKYISSGNYFWNSGMYFSSSKNILESIQKYSKEIHSSCEITWENKKVEDNIYILKKKFMLKIPNISIDYSVIEKETSIGCIKTDIGWNDIGSWDVLSEILNKNFKINDARHVNVNSDNNFIMSDDIKVTTIGVKNFLIIKKDNNLLIVKKGYSELIKELNTE
jgi:mannose-1-phosphate guanylyltransferase